ncbi:MAG: DNA (cytosine-5-)-methyltransferase [Bacteroidota bacterium]|nr:DNA (cytosine-5-)-methyltransferase [Bacteroidota bacterium]
MTVFKLGELFCGPGGIGLGAKLSGFKHNGNNYGVVHKWATDYDEDTCNTYNTNICNGNGHLITQDIRDLDINTLSEIDALAFGFPCNDFSIVGEQKGINGTFGPLYLYGVRALRKFQPSWFLAENVGGLKNSNEGKAFEKILDELQLSGYKIYPHLYKFEEYGIPQARHRIIIIGIREDIPLEFKIPIIKNCKLKTAKEAIENPPIFKDAFNHVFTKQSKTVMERLSYIKPGENAFNANLPSHLKLNVKGAKISQIYKRLDPNKPSYTVTGSGGGGTHVYHWEENRALTNRERARLQTFPDDFKFIGTKESVRKQIGMAVPVEGARIVIESVLKTFAGIKYDSISPNIRVKNTHNLFGVLMEAETKYFKSHKN